MSASSRDLSIPDGLILFLPAVPGMLFLYIAEVIPKVCAGLGLELGLSGYALLEAVFIGCALSPAAGLPLYCWYFFRRGLGSNPVYPALFYLAQSFASILGMTLLVPRCPGRGAVRLPAAAAHCPGAAPPADDRHIRRDLPPGAPPHGTIACPGPA